MVMQSIAATGALVEAPNQSVNQEGSDSNNLATSVQSTAPFSQPTTSAFTLLVATYNHEKWLELTTTAQEAAHDKAEAVFPETPNDPEHPIKYTYRYLNTFFTEFHTWLDEELRDIPQPTQEQRDAAVSKVMTEHYPPDEKSFGIGWIAIVPAAEVAQFMQEVGKDASGNDGALWNMYDMQILPLNLDETVWEFYKRMTPAHWGR